MIGFFFLGRKYWQYKECVKVVHLLKTDMPIYQDIAWGLKKFEIRKDDRSFAKNDVLWLAEYDRNREAFTGRNVYRRVQYILRPNEFQSWGLQEGYCCMSLIAVDGPVYLFDLNDEEARLEALQELNHYFS